MSLLAAAILLANGLVPSPTPPQPIVGGEAAGVCSWPTSVYVGGCSGTLIHPEIVLYAAHCGAGASDVILGEDSIGGTPVATAGCEIHPEYDGTDIGVDFAYCRLAAPVDIPIAPIIMGCELDQLGPDVPLVTTGWGSTPEGPGGAKRVVQLPIVEVFLDSWVIQAGGGDVSLCGGDSGGGSFVQLDDGSWRMVAVSSAVLGTPCTDAQAALAMATHAVSWIEDTSGLDVTPCFDADGSWNPGDGCQQLPLDPATGGGAWPACEFGALSDWGSTCGPAAGGPPDRTPPTIAITSPADGAVIPLDGAMASVTVTFDVADDGWGVAMTSLRIDGTDVPGSEDDAVPFEIPPLGLPEGVYTLEAIAVDHGDNQTVSSPVEIIVGDPAMPSDTSGGQDTSGGSSGAPPTSEGTADDSPDASDDGPSGGDDPTAADDGSTSAAGATDPGQGGCGCGGLAPRPGGSWLAGVLLVARRRRCGLRRG